MKKMINALMASFVMDEPQVGPTVVTEILSAGTVVVVVDAAVVVVVDADPAAPAFAVVVVEWAVVVVELAEVCDPRGAWAAVSSSIAFWTFLLTCCWLA
jgi:hypothetical protein